MSIVNDFIGWLSHSSSPSRARADVVDLESRRRMAREHRPTVPLMRESLPGQRGRLEHDASASRDTAPPRWLLAASQITGRALFDKEGCRIGEIRDLSIDKKSGRIVYALVALERSGAVLHPLPWSLLRYDFDEEGYICPLKAAAIEAGPSLQAGDLAGFGLGEGEWRGELAKHYDASLMPSY
jgi:hypothetical protein